MSLVLYHNPRCTKSREALALLEARGEKPKIVLYLETPPSAAEIKRLLKLLGLKARDLIRTREDVYSELRLDRPGLSEQELIDAMAAHPILIERPILVAGNRAVLGRPPERVLEII